MDVKVPHCPSVIHYEMLNYYFKMHTFCMNLLLLYISKQYKIKFAEVL